MKCKFKAYQTIYKIVEIEAANEDTAYEKVQRMLDDGEIRFDNKPWLEMEVQINRLK